MFNKKGRIILFLIAIPLMIAGFKPGANNNNNNNNNNSVSDSLKALLEKPNIHDTTRLDAKIRLCYHLRSKDPNAAIGYGKTAIIKAQDLRLDNKKALALNGVGNIYYRMGEYVNSMDYFLKAKNLHLENNDSIGYANSLTNLGLLYSTQSYYEKAIEYYFDALRIFEAKDNIVGKGAIYNNIGAIYQNRKELELAEQYHSLSLDYKKKSGDMHGLGYSYNNLGIIHKKKGNLDKASDYFQKAYEIRYELEATRDIASTIGYIGKLLILKNDYDNALKHLDSALTFYKKTNDQAGISKTHNRIGQAFLGKKNTSEAEYHFRQSYDIAQRIGLTRMITKYYENLAKLNEEKSNYLKAYTFQKKYNSLTDSIYSKESKQRIYELQMMFDREREKQELELYKKSARINELNYEKQRLLKNFLIAGVILIVVLLLLLYNRYLVINKTNKLLQKRKEDISQNNKELINLNKILLEQKKKVDDLNQQLNQANKNLLESEKHLIKANAAKDKLFSIISHDLRNPFAAIVSFSRMLKRDIDDMDKEELKELTLDLDKAVANINDLLENLLYWSRSQTGKIEYNPQHIDLGKIVNDNIDLFLPKAKEKQISIENNINSNLTVWADQNMTDTVIRNLLSNAIKFTDSKGKIKLYSETNEDQAYI